MRKISIVKYISPLFFCLVLTFSSCGTKKEIVDLGPVPERTKEELISALTEHNYQFTWFAGEASMKVKSPSESITAKAYLRIRRDSVIWAVVKKLGVEGGRVLVTPKSYATIDRINGSYSKGETADVLSRMGIDFDYYDAQEAIYGNVILPENDAYIEVSKKDAIYSLAYNVSGLSIKYWVNAYDLKIERILLYNDQEREIEIEFSKYKDVDGVTLFPYHRKYMIKDPSTGTTYIDLNFKKVILDTPKSTKFSIPSHYDKVD